MGPLDRPPSAERETFAGGPARESMLDRLTTMWRRRVVVLLAVVCGVIGGGGMVWWWHDRSSGESPIPSRTSSAGQDVRLILTGVESRSAGKHRSGVAADGSLWLDAVLLHGRGPGTATVTRVHRPGRSIAVRVPELPVRLSVNHSFERVRLQLTPNNCRLATTWTPSSQPFTLTWRDDGDDVQQDVGGDHDSAMELTLIRYFDAACRSGGG